MGSCGPPHTALWVTVGLPGYLNSLQSLAFTDSATKTLIAFYIKVWAHTRVFLQDHLLEHTWSYACQQDKVGGLGTSESEGACVSLPRPTARHPPPDVPKDTGLAAHFSVMPSDGRKSLAATPCAFLCYYQG